MESNEPVRTILGQKGPGLWWVTPQTSVYDALRLMSEKSVGALPVLDGARVAGILSERDYARKVILMGRSSRETHVSEIMTSPAITVSPDATVSDCMRTM